MHNKNKKNICFVVIQYNKPVPHRHIIYLICFLYSAKVVSNKKLWLHFGNWVNKSIVEFHLLSLQMTVWTQPSMKPITDVARSSWYLLPSGPNSSGIDVERGIEIRYLEII